MVGEASRIVESGAGLHGCDFGSRACDPSAASRRPQTPAVGAGWQYPVAERRIAFAAHDFAQNPARSLLPLVDAGLVLEEDGVYLGLPVPHNHRPMNGLPEILRSTLAGGSAMV